MKSYQVVAIDKTGKTIQDIIAAEDDKDLSQIVKSRDLYLLEFKEGLSTSDSITKLRMKSIVVFCRQLGTMVASGIPIVQALDMLQAKADSTKARKIFRNIYEEVQKGNSLSKAMQLQKGAFPELLTNMVMAGEMGGTLDQSLGRMSVHYEKEQKLNNKVRTASIYPAILGIVSIAVILMLVTFVLPTITGMFPVENIPWTTQIILGFSNFLTSNWIAIIGTILVMIVLTRIALTIRDIRIQFDKLKLLLPVIGPLNQTIYSARVARTMASLYSSGVQTLDMLETTSRVINNTYLEDQFIDVITDVTKGEFISKAIESTGSFDPMLSSMIYIGEESGSLGEILNSTADYFDNEADSALQRLIAMMEPIMLIVIGIIIGFIVISIIQPIFTMYESIGA
jgi:type IV pilus assembly protein PilC